MWIHPDYRIKGISKFTGGPKFLNSTYCLPLQIKKAKEVGLNSVFISRENNLIGFRQYIDLKDPLMYNIVMGLESYIKTKLYTNLELKSMWINKIDINSNKDDNFHKDTSPYSLILYLNDDYIGGELEYVNDTNNRLKITPQKNLEVNYLK